MSETDQLFDILRGNVFRADPNQIPQESLAGGGNAQPAGWYDQYGSNFAVGQSNLLGDPSMESISPASFTASEARNSVDWYLKRVLTSGTAPTTNTLEQVSRAVIATNSFGSSLAVMAITGAGAACDITNEFYTKTVLTIGANSAPYLVGAIRVYRYTTPWNTTAVTTFTLTLELVKNIAGTPVVVASKVVDLLTFAANDRQLLSVAVASPLTASDTYDLRAKIRFVSTGSASTSLQFGTAEPQLGWSNTAEPLPFLPERLVEFTFGGDGSDGAVVVNSGTFSSGPITSNALTRDAYFTNLTIESTRTLDTKGFRIFCTGYALINGTLQCNGGAGGNGGTGAGTAGTAGAAASASGAPMPSVAGQAGDAGFTTPTAGARTSGHNAVQVLPSVGSPAKGGGGGGVGGGGGSVTAGTDTSQAATPNGSRQFVTIVNWATLYSAAWAILNGSDQAGSGGRGYSNGTGQSGSGGGSGAAGGNVVLVARLVSGSGAIEAKGGNGGNGGDASGGGSNGGGGGGSGGSGGVVYLLTSTNTFAGTISKTAGTAGAPGLDGDGVTQAGSGLNGLGGTETFLYMMRRLALA